MISYEIIIPPEECEKAAKINKITVNKDGYTHEAIIKMDESILHRRNEGTSLDGDNLTSCKNRGQVKHYSYETHLHKKKLKVNLETQQVQNPHGIPLACTVLEGGRESTSLDPYAYKWDITENCAVTKLFSQKRNWSSTVISYADLLSDPAQWLKSENSYLQ